MVATLLEKRKWVAIGENGWPGENSVAAAACAAGESSVACNGENNISLWRRKAKMAIGEENSGRSCGAAIVSVRAGACEMAKSA